MLHALLNLVSRIIRLQLDGEVVQRVNGHRAVDRITSELERVRLSELFRKDKDRPLDQEVLIVAHIDAFMNESERAKAGNGHTLVGRMKRGTCSGNRLLSIVS